MRWPASLLVLLWTVGSCASRDVDDALVSPLIFAALNGDEKAITDLLILGAPVDAKDNEALIMACTAGARNAIKVLVQHKADVRARDCECLVRAASTPHVDVVKYLVEGLQLPVSAQSHEALISAVASNRLDIVLYLIDNGADVNARNGLPLRVALKSTLLLNIVEALLQAGADLNEETLLSGVKDHNADLVALALHHGVPGGCRNGVVMDIAFQENEAIGDMLVDNVAPTVVWGDPVFLDNIRSPNHAILIRILKHNKVSRDGIIRAMESAVANEDSDLLRTLLTSIEEGILFEVSSHVVLSANDKVLRGLTVRGLSKILYDHLLATVIEKGKNGDAPELVKRLIACESERSPAERCVSAILCSIDVMQMFNQGDDDVNVGAHREPSVAVSPEPSDVDNTEGSSQMPSATVTRTPALTRPLPSLRASLEHLSGHIELPKHIARRNNQGPRGGSPPAKRPR
ncbi:Ankyrin repeat domain-containing protein [Plasmodiophora brassicae]